MRQRSLRLPAPTDRQVKEQCLHNVCQTHSGHAMALEGALLAALGPLPIGSSVRRTLASKLRGPGFKFQSGTVGGLVTIIIWGAGPEWKLAFS